MNTRIFSVVTLLLVCFTSFGCSTEKKLEAVLESYVDYPVASLRNQMGEPEKILRLDDNGDSVYVYGFSRTAYVPQTTRFNSANTQANTYGGYYKNYYCTLKFSITNNKVSSASYKGTSCSNYAKHQYVNPQFILDLPNLYKTIYGINYKKIKRGIRITDVKDGSHAQEAGLQKGDLIISINKKSVLGLPIEFTDDLLNNNNQISLEVVRKNETKNISIKKTKFPKASFYKKSIKKFLGYDSVVL